MEIARTWVHEEQFRLPYDEPVLTTSSLCVGGPLRIILRPYSMERVSTSVPAVASNQRLRNSP